MTVLTVQANGVGTPDNWTLTAGASKAAAVNAPDDGATSYISSTTTDENVQTFTAAPGLPSGATISQVAIRARAKRGGASDAKFVVGYSFTKQGGGTQSGESGEYTSASSFGDFTFTHNGLSANWGSGFTFYARNTQTRAVQLTTLEVEFTYTALVVAPAGLAVGKTFGGATVYRHKVVMGVTTGGDDGREATSTGAMTIASGTLSCSSTTKALFIIRDVVIPAEANVSTARIELHLPEGGNVGNPALTIRGEGNPADLTSTNYDISNRTPTAAGVVWSASGMGSGSYHNSPDIKTIIQEIVDSEEWSAGGDMAFLLLDNGTGGSITVDSYEAGSGANPPRLVIEWTFGAPDQDVAPSGKAVGATLGGATVGRGAVGIAPAGKAVGRTIGTAAVGRGAVGIAPAGKAVGRTIGTAKVGLMIAPAGKGVAAAFGAARVGRVVAPSGKAVSATLGGATVGRGVVGIAPAGKGVGAVVGGAVVTTTGALVRPSGLGVARAIGGATVGRGAVGIAPAGKGVGVLLGTAAVGLAIAPTGTASGVGFGMAALGRGPVAIAPAGLEAGAAVGGARAWMHQLVVALGEDGYEDAAGAVYLTTTSLNVNAATPFVAFRAMAAMPAEATIQAAWVELWPETYHLPRLIIYCELAAAGAALAATAHNLSNREGTEASAPWSADVAIGQHVASPNFGAAVQELVNLPAWGEGGSVVVVLQDAGEGGWLRIYSADAGAAFRPRLVVTWAWPGSAAALTIGPVGKGVGVGLGATVISTGAMGIAAAGLGVGAVAGGATVTGGAIVIGPAGSAIAVAVGAPTVVGGLLIIGPAGLAVGWAGGSAALGLRLGPAGLAAGAGSGVATISRGVMGIAPAGQAVGAGFGGPVVQRGALIIAPAGRGVGAAGGGATVGRGAVGIAPAGLGVGIAAGAARATAVIRPAGLAVGLGVGTAALGLRLAAAGLGVGATAGALVVWLGAVGIAPGGVAVGSTAGAATVGRGAVGIAPAGKGVAVAAGAASLAITTQFIRPGGVNAAGLMGLLLVIAARTPDSRIYRVPRRRV